MITAPADSAMLQRRSSTGHRLGVPTVVIGSLALAGLSLLVLPRGIAYDPWSWLVWGREALHGHLDTRGSATSMKPLPFMITTLLSVFGPASPMLWLFIARASAIAGAGFAWRVAARLDGPIAGAIAVIGIVTIYQYSSYLFFAGMSEPMATTTAIIALDAALLGRHRVATGGLLATALLRIEAWPILGLYLLWRLWSGRSDRVGNARRLVASGVVLAVLPLAWFGFDWLGSRQLLRSAGAASQQSQGGPLLSANPGVATLQESVHLLLAPLSVAFVLTIVIAGFNVVRHRDELSAKLLVASAAALGWLVVAAVMAQARIATGAIRYLVPPAGIAVIVAAIGSSIAMRVLLDRLASHRPAAVVAATAAVVIGVAAPQLIACGRRVANEWPGNIALQQLAQRMPTAVRHAGGARKLECGTLATSAFQVPVLAWTLNVPEQNLGPHPGATGTVLAEGDLPRFAPGVRESYRVVATTGSTANDWTVLTTC